MRRFMASFVTEMGRVLAAAALVLLFAAPAQATPADDFTRLLHDDDEAQLQLYPSLANQRNDKRHLGRYEDTLSSAHLADERRTNIAERARLARIDRSALS